MWEPSDMDDAIDQAIETLFWSSPAIGTEEVEAEVPDGYAGLCMDAYVQDNFVNGRHALDSDDFERLALEVVDFLTAYEGPVRRAMRVSPGYGLTNAAHDFILTRNHHGAGFWDRGLGIAGDILTQGADDAGGVAPYVTDRGGVALMDA